MLLPSQKGQLHQECVLKMIQRANSIIAQSLVDCTEYSAPILCFLLYAVSFVLQIHVYCGTGFLRSFCRCNSPPIMTLSPRVSHPMDKIDNLKSLCHPATLRENVLWSMNVVFGVAGVVCYWSLPLPQHFILQKQWHSVERIPRPRPNSPLEFKSSCTKIAQTHRYHFYKIVWFPPPIRVNAIKLPNQNSMGPSLTHIVSCGNLFSGYCTILLRIKQRKI